MTKPCTFCGGSGWQNPSTVCGWCRGATRAAPVDPPKPCRCGCPDYAHTGQYGIPGACTGGCGCSQYEPHDPADDPVAGPNLHPRDYGEVHPFYAAGQVEEEVA